MLWARHLGVPSSPLTTSPPVLGEEAGAKAAEGNTATAEPDHQWDRVGRCGNVAVELLVRNQTHH